MLQQIHFIAQAGSAGCLDVQVGGPSTLFGQVLRVVRLAGLAQHRNLRFPAWRRCLNGPSERPRKKNKRNKQGQLDTGAWTQTRIEKKGASTKTSTINLLREVRIVWRCCCMGVLWADFDQHARRLHHNV